MSAPRDAIDAGTIAALAALRESGRGGLERRARDLARLVEQREALLRELAEAAFADDWEHERLKALKALLHDWRER